MYENGKKQVQILKQKMKETEEIKDIIRYSCYDDIEVCCDYYWHGVLSHEEIKQTILSTVNDMIDELIKDNKKLAVDSLEISWTLENKEDEESEV